MVDCAAAASDEEELLNFSNWGVGSSFWGWVWGFRVLGVLRGLAMMVIPRSSFSDVGSSILVGSDEKSEEL